MYDKNISFSLLSIVHSVSSDLGTKFFHQNMKDLLQVYEVDSVNCTFKI